MTTTIFPCPTEPMVLAVRPGVAAPDAHAAPLLPSATADLVADAPMFDPALEATRLGKGLGLAALYGLALGARSGGRALVVHAGAVPLGLALVLALGAPAMTIALALVDAPIEPGRVVSIVARGAARAGLVLAGLAPAAGLYVVTSSGHAAAALAASAGLFVGGLVGLRSVRADVGFAVRGGDAKARTASLAIATLFGLFAVALAARFFTAALPLFGGAR